MNHDPTDKKTTVAGKKISDAFIKKKIKRKRERGSDKITGRVDEGPGGLSSGS